MADIVSVQKSYGGFKILLEDGSSRQLQSYGSGELVGHNSESLVVEDNGYALILDLDGRVQGRIQLFADMRVTSVTHNSVVVRESGYIKIYDMRGNRTSSRQVL